MTLARVSALAIGVFLCAGPLDAQAALKQPLAASADSALEARTREVASQLRCPVCQGLSLQDSPSELSQQMRGLVKDQLRAGRTPYEVRRYFVARYGEWILMEPPAHGFNWLVYGLPALVLLAGLGVVVMAIKRWTALSSPAQATDAEESELHRA